PELKGSWMLAGRRTYFDMIANGLWKNLVKPKFSEEEQKDMPDKIFPYYFYDFQGKMNLDIANDHRLTWSTFYGDDIVNYDYTSTSYYDNGESSYEGKDDIYFDWRWGNFTNSLSWRWIVSPKLILKSSLANSRFRFRVDMDNEFYNYYESPYDTSTSTNIFKMDIHDIIEDNSISTSLLWYFNDNHKIKAGLQSKSLLFNLAFIFSIDENYNGEQFSFTDTLMYMESMPFERSAYIQDSWQVSPLLSCQPGLRMTYFSGSQKMYYSPRFAVKYFIQDNISAKFSIGRYYQFLTVANPPDENLRFLDIWFAIPEKYNIPQADHFIFGLEYLSDSDILFRSETYYKSFEHLLTLKPSEMISLNDDGMLRIDPFNEFWDT
ncbi:MAG: hypothetical protein KAI81_04800, partial [Candidatus Marinimicrobia bacterium]|nr:hypothetical protein [Candidatus Neomarinimicrobiota bacterium]